MDKHLFDRSVSLLTILKSMAQGKVIVMRIQLNIFRKRLDLVQLRSLGLFETWCSSSEKVSFDEERNRHIEESSKQVENVYEAKELKQISKLLGISISFSTQLFLKHQIF